MPDLSNWTYGHPSATSRRRDFPAGHRSDKSHTRAAWEQEHYFEDGSANSAGVHKPGSGRWVEAADTTAIPSQGTMSGEVTYGTTTGRLWYTGPDASEAHPLSTGTSFRLVVVGPQSLTTDNAWTLSFTTMADDPGSNTSWFANPAFGPFEGIPYVFHTVAGWASSISVFFASLVTVTTQGGTFTAYEANSQVDQRVQVKSAPSAHTAYVNVLAVGQLPRSQLS